MTQPAYHARAPHVRLTRRTVPSTELVRRTLGDPNRTLTTFTVYLDGRAVFGSTELPAAISAARDLRGAA